MKLQIYLLSHVLSQTFLIIKTLVTASTLVRFEQILYDNDRTHTSSPQCESGYVWLERIFWQKIYDNNHTHTLSHLCESEYNCLDWICEQTIYDNDQTCTFSPHCVSEYD